MNWFDVVAAALLMLFAWRGYRRGLLAWLVRLGATVLAFALAVALSPVVAPLLTGGAGWSRVISERLAFIVLLIGLRIVLGWAVNEFVGAMRPLLGAIPLLGLLDHLLGIFPSLVVGALLVLILLVAALVLPVDRRLHRAAAESYLGRTAISEAARAADRFHSGGLLPDASRVLAPILETHAIH